MWELIGKEVVVFGEVVTYDTMSPEILDIVCLEDCNYR